MPSWKQIYSHHMHVWVNAYYAYIYKVEQILNIKYLNKCLQQFLNLIAILIYAYKMTTKILSECFLFISNTFKAQKCIIYSINIFISSPYQYITDISQYIFRKSICFSKSVITTFIISNIIFLAILLLNMCVKVPRGRNLRKQDNGNGVIELCYLSFLSPQIKEYLTHSREWMNEWMSEWTVPNREEENQMRGIWQNVLLSEQSFQLRAK